MYIRKRRVKKKGRIYEHWDLVECERTERGPRRKSVAYLGVAEPGARIGMKLAACGERWPHQKSLIDDVEPEWVEVDVKRVRFERTRILLQA